MRFQKGNKLSKGGTRGNKGGRPTKEESEIKKALIAKYWAKVDAELDKILTKYFADPSNAKDIINRVIPYTRQEIGLSSKVEHGLDREMLERLMRTPEGRAASEAVTKALMKNRNAVASKSEEINHDFPKRRG